MKMTNVEAMKMLKDWNFSKTAIVNFSTDEAGMTTISLTVTNTEAMKMLKNWQFPKTAIVNFSTDATGMTAIDVMS